MAEYRARKQQGGVHSEGSDRPADLGDFSHEAFVDAITQFIIADDQVRMFPKTIINILTHFNGYLVTECD